MNLKRTFCAFSIYFLIANHLLFGQNFCVPTFKNKSFGIDNFAFHSLVNLYSNIKSPGYTFYSDSLFTTSINIGHKYPITISLEHSTGISSNFAALIDYNGDSLFDRSELVYYDSNNCYSTSGFVTIPNDTNYLGKRILRIIMSGFAFGIDPCGFYPGGEAEDYVVNIVSNKPETQSYCMPFNQFNNDVYIIEDFRIGKLTNKKSGSNSSGYVFYPINLFSTNLFLNTSDSIYVSNGLTAGITGGFSVWIDLDNNGDFANSERLFSSGPNQRSAKGVLTIPNDSSFIGIRRLRVRSQSGGIPQEPCGLFSTGETEDYIVNHYCPTLVKTFSVG